jgi:hypothetical protein
LFGLAPGTTNNTNFFIEFQANDTLAIDGYSLLWRATTQVFRDPSSFYHIVCSVDTTQATASNRIRLYINGAEITAFSTTNNPTQNDDLGVNQASAHYIGSVSSSLYLNGYLTEINFIDGSALTASDFGEYNTDTGVWQPIAYEGSYGTNGFYLPLNNTTSIYNLTGDQKSGTITRYTTPGTYTFTVPSYSSSVVVELWGGGGGSGGSGPTPGGANGGAGSASTFAAPGGTLSAGGGGGGATSTSGLGAMGAGGTASGGDVNTNGTTGTGVAGSSTTGYAAPNGYWNSVATTQASNGPAFVGKFAGGAATGSNWYVGGGAPIGGSGGSGAYVKKTYSAGVLTSGSTITVVVGSGGTAGGQGGAWTGAAGADGEVRITVDGVTIPADWFPANISITAGAGNDSLVDSPTRYGTDTGAGGEVRGNYATLNPLSKLNWLSQNSTVTPSNGNLEFAVGSAGNMMDCTIAVSSGKWYWETTQSAYIFNGIRSTRGIPTGDLTYRYYQGNGQIVYIPYNTTSQTVLTTVATATSGDIIGIALDLDNQTISWYKNNSLLYTATSIVADEYAPCTGGAAGSSGAFINFGQRPFAYTAPSGFKALCTQNLPEPTVADGSEYFNAVLWTGNATNRSITTGMAPDFVWIKHRSTAENHNLYDVLRGVGYRLESNSSDVQTYYSDRLTAFTSTGFNLGTGYNNTSGTTYVGWAWKANGAGVSNNIGTIPSTVSANTTAGFSVVTWSGTGTNGTVGHGLGATPSLVIVKQLNSTANWNVWFEGYGADGYLLLNSTAAKGTYSGNWGAGTFNSTVFSVSSGAWNNGSGSTYVGYVFSEISGFSFFGTYTGNGSSDGVFVHLGFKPKFWMSKRTDSTSSWLIVDGARNTYNIVDDYLVPNSSSAEGSATVMDFVSNGVKFRGTTHNDSGATWIYMAFAENPFKYSLAR